MGGAKRAGGGAERKERSNYLFSVGLLTQALSRPSPLSPPLSHLGNLAGRCTLNQFGAYMHYIKFKSVYDRSNLLGICGAERHQASVSGQKFWKNKNKKLN